MNFVVTQWLQHIGNGGNDCEIKCPYCDRKFYYQKGNPHNNGRVTCSNCGKGDRMENIRGIFFTLITSDLGNGLRNWQCMNPKCGCQFPARPESTEETIECPNCHARKVDDDGHPWNPVFAGDATEDKLNYNTNNVPVPHDVEVTRSEQL